MRVCSQPEHVVRFQDVAGFTTVDKAVGKGRSEMVVATIVVAWSSSALEETFLPRHTSLCPGRVESAKRVNKDEWLFGGVDRGCEGCHWAFTQYTERCGRLVVRGADDTSSERPGEATLTAVKFHDQNLSEDKRNAVGDLCLWDSACCFQLVLDQITIHTYGSEPKGT